MGTKKTAIFVLVWIFSIVIIWIGLAYILATWSVIGPIPEMFIQNLSHFIIIRSALFFGSIAAIAVYFVHSRFQRLYRPTQNLK